MRPSEDTRARAVADLRRGYVRTWVNGRRVVEAEVAPGDELWLGDCRFRI